jgi:hypothetical protein
MLNFNGSQLRWAALGGLGRLLLLVLSVTAAHQQQCAPPPQLSHHDIL